MKCPYCGAEDQSRVVDTTRDAQGGIRRRRECKPCTKRFSTYERVLRATPLLIKSNGEREAFDREKLVRGIQIACAKRPIAASDITGLVDEIETFLQNIGRDEVPSRIVGDMVIEGLKKFDPIAYIRYAIVYLRLDNLTSIQGLLDSLLADQSGGKVRQMSRLATAPTTETGNGQVSGAPPNTAASSEKEAAGEISADSEPPSKPESAAASSATSEAR